MSVPAHHKTVALQVWVDVDEGVADVVRHLNTMEGVRTHASCEGTPCLLYPGGLTCYVQVTWADDAALARIQAAYPVRIESAENHWGYVLPKGGAPLEQIQVSLGHASVVTTERYVAMDQDFTDAPCDHLGLR